MSRIDSNKFKSDFQSGIDIDNLSEETKATLENAGINQAELAEMDTDKDGKIYGNEQNRLFNELDTFDNVKKKSDGYVDTKINHKATFSGEAYHALKAEYDKNVHNARMQGPAPLNATAPSKVVTTQSFRSWSVDDVALFAGNLKKTERVELMKEIAKRFGIPQNGFAGRQAHLFERSDVRLFGLLHLLTRPRNAEAATINLERVTEHFPEQSLSLVLVTAARESQKSITASSRALINTWEEGGLDFLWQNRSRLGLPESVTRHWKEAPAFTSPETGNTVHPGLIPANDQILAYGAQTRSSFQRFETYVKTKLGESAGEQALSNLSLEARLVWQAFAFLAPGGREFDPDVGAIHGQSFGVRSAFGLLAHKAAKEGRSIDLNAILTDVELHRTHAISSAKVRAAEAMFLDELSSRETKDSEPRRLIDRDCVIKAF